MLIFRERELKGLPKTMAARCNWPQLLWCPCQCSFCLFVCFFFLAKLIIIINIYEELIAQKVASHTESVSVEAHLDEVHRERIGKF